MLDLDLPILPDLQLQLNASQKRPRLELEVPSMVKLLPNGGWGLRPLVLMQVKVEIIRAGTRMTLVPP